MQIFIAVAGNGSLVVLFTAGCDAKAFKPDCNEMAAKTDDAMNFLRLIEWLIN
jgi:hypothetical protein